MPIYAPRLIAAGSHYEGPTPAEYPRAYQLHDQRGGAHAAYRIVLALNPALGQYYGIQGTTWQYPPIMNSPNQRRMINGKQLELHRNGQKLSLVGWRTPQGSYWISNTLTDDLTNPQMLAIAASLTRVR
jgi:hypothetical protein